MPRRPKLKLLPEPSAATGYVLDDQVGFLLRVAMQRHTSIFMSQMIGDLTQTQFAALAKLLEVGPCSQNHLGRLIYLDASTIKGVVDRLQLRGLVATCDDPNDRRHVTARITTKGRDLLEKVGNLASNPIEQRFSRLSPDQLQMLIEALDVIREG